MIFVHTGAWIALSDKSDQYHNSAVEIYKALKLKRERLLTTDHVIDETATRLRYDANHGVAVRFLDLIDKSEKAGILALVRIDESIFKDATAVFRKYDTVVLSFTDCTSFAVCQKHYVNKAFAFDQHFEIVGISLCSELT